MKEAHHLCWHYFETEIDFLKLRYEKRDFNDEFTVSNKDPDGGC